MFSSGDCKVILGGVGGVVKVLDGRTLTLLQSFSLLDAVAVPKGGESRLLYFAFSHLHCSMYVCLVYVCVQVDLPPPRDRDLRALADRPHRERC